MSLLDDVRAAYCSCDASESNHNDRYCIEALKDRIVAALEAALGLIDFGFVAEYHDGDYGEYNAARCGACSNLIDDSSDHAPDCRGVALVMALKGDAPTA